MVIQFSLVVVAKTLKLGQQLIGFLFAIILNQLSQRGEEREIKEVLFFFF